MNDWRALNTQARGALAFTAISAYGIAVLAWLCAAGAPASILVLWGVLVIVVPSLSGALFWYWAAKLGRRRRDDGGGGEGGRGPDTPSPPPSPRGGVEFDWDGFQAQFAEHVRAREPAGVR